MRAPRSTEVFDTASDGVTPLEWMVWTPSGSGPWPVALMIHGGEFKAGTNHDANLAYAANGLSLAGFLCLSVGYRLDKNHVTGQITNCYCPGQTDDVKRAVKKARLDSRCLNGIVFAVGGSAGATHAFSVATEVADSDCDGATTWGAEDRVKAAICMSGAYKFEDRTDNPYLTKFVADINRYCNSSDLTDQEALSPLTLMDTTVQPLYIVSSEYDPMPTPQFDAVCAKLTEIEATDCQTLLLTGSVQHSFDYWPAIMDGATAFLEAHLE